MLQLFLRSFLVLILCGIQLVPAQTPCQPPTLPIASNAPNIFSEEQEAWLGEAIAEQLQKDFRVIADDDMVTPLRLIGERLMRHLPPNKIKFQFFLVDIPDANAFVLPGGRIYVSRKLIAYVQNEDELAGVIAHEISHLVARQQAIEMTEIMRKVINVTQVTDRADIFEKYNRLVENVARKPGALGGRQHHDERKTELDADQIGLFAMVAAGYDPQGQAKLFDRIAETKGKTGSFFSDVFGLTRPESKRLREMQRNFAALPANCVEERIATHDADFAKWQALIVSYTGAGRKESLPNLVSKMTLDPPLRGDITHLRFSPDGNYVLAQDDTGINVLTREPFAVKFRIDAQEARYAEFTPDSQSIVFHTPGLRVETWNLADEKLQEAHEIVIRQSCLQTQLAPDGKTLACLDDDFNLNLFEVASNTLIFQKKQFYVPDPFFALLNNLVKVLNTGEIDDNTFDVVNFGFAPDGHYFVAGVRGVAINALGINMENAALVYDLTTRAQVKMKGNVNKLIAGGFCFLEPNRLLVQNPEDPNKSGILSLPDGAMLETFAMFRGKLSPVAKGNYVLVRPLQQFAVGVVDLATKEGFRVNKNRAFDVWGDLAVSERTTGEIGLYFGRKNELKGTVVLPRNPLGRLRALALSSDTKWLAVSERSRGAVWDLQKGQRVMHVRGFRGAHFNDKGHLFADFPEAGEMKRQVAVLDVATKNAVDGKLLEERSSEQHGPFITLLKPAKKDSGYGENVNLEIRRADSLDLLWQRNFPKEAPRTFLAPEMNSLALTWPVAAKAAQAEIKADPRLSQQMAALKEKEGDYFVQVLEASTGNVRGKFLMETGKGSFRVRDIFTDNDWIVMADNQNRVLLYSLATGEQKGRVFGNRPALSAAAQRLAVQNEPGQLVLYDLATMQKREEFSFTHPIAYTRFTADGKQLFVLTANQAIYWLKVTDPKR